MTLKILIIYLLTIENVLQFLAHPDALQVRLRTRIANFVNSGVLCPKRSHQAAKKNNISKVSNLRVNDKKILTID